MKSKTPIKNLTAVRIPVFLISLFACSLLLIIAISSRPAAVAAATAQPKSKCNSAQSESDKKKCRRKWDDCENLKDKAKIVACKNAVIDNYTKKSSVGGAKPFSQPKKDGYQCGNLPDDADNVNTKINFGCLGEKGPNGLGPIQDIVFALIRFLSVGVGIAVTLSLIIAGIQYSTAEGNPESSQKAKLRAQQALIGLIIYIFAWSLLQFLIPGGLFNT